MRTNAYPIILGVFEDAGLPPPRETVWFRSKSVQAGVSRDESGIGSCVLYVSKKVLRLPENEIRALVAHEAAHVKNGDLYSHRGYIIAHWLSVSLAALMGSYSLVTAILGGTISELYGLLSLLPIVVALVCLAVLRNREYAADRTAAEITGDPDSLVKLLGKLSTPHTYEWVWFFGTHPPTSERIKRVRRMK